ncbi:MAG TPA: GNAT family N-acetyltransferase [Thermodesulfobacteriota bacterium]|nr:GNAT family N-acetyltransferase [Thermodesulfobacteriota bacterium]
MIRPFSFSDLDAILEIESQSFPKSPYDWATFVNLQTLYPETFLVCVDTNHDLREEILGYIIFSRDGHIISIAVHLQHRRKGIGTYLLRRAMKTPRLRKVWAEVRKSNHGAQGFYSKMGFQIEGVVSNYYGNEDALIIQRTLS